MKKSSIQFLSNYITIDEQGKVVVKEHKKSQLKSLLKDKEESCFDLLEEQTINEFKRKMPYTLHQIKCEVCGKEAEVKAIGIRKPRKVCYQESCIKANNRLKMQKSRAKS